MKKLMLIGAVVGLLGCGGSDSTTAQQYHLAGSWVLWSGNAVVAHMNIDPDVATGTYTEAGVDYAMTAHTFDAQGPDFSLAFGSKTVAGHLESASNSNVFTGPLVGVRQ